MKRFWFLAFLINGLIFLGGSFFLMDYFFASTPYKKTSLKKTATIQLALIEPPFEKESKSHKYSVSDKNQIQPKIEEPNKKSVNEIENRKQVFPKKKASKLDKKKKVEEKTKAKNQNGADQKHQLSSKGNQLKKDQVRQKIYQNLIFPPIAKERGQQGLVKISFVIDATGRISAGKVNVIRSSGFGLLDRAAVRAALNAQPFAVEAKGPITASIRFRLD